jgi:hypothetical protein
MGRPQISCSTFGMSVTIRVDLPAARTIAAVGFRHHATSKSERCQLCEPGSRTSHRLEFFRR